MKNLSLILNVILLIAVSVLFYMQFSTPSVGGNSNEKEGKSSDYTMAFVNSDSLLTNYEYFIEKQSELEEKGKKLENDYQNRALGLQKELNDYQRNINSLTIGQAKAVEENLLKKQQNLRLYQESLTQELMKAESQINQELYKKVTEFIENYSEEKGLQLVVKFNQGSDILYANSGMDITHEIINGLNTAYTVEKTAPKEKKEAATDSASAQ